MFDEAPKEHPPYIFYKNGLSEEEIGRCNYQPTEQDYKKLKTEIHSYLEMFAEPAQEMRMGM